MSWLQDLAKLAADKVLVKEQVEPEIAEKRWATCWNCEYMDHEKKTCKLCGCFLEVKIWAKVSRAKHRPMGEITHCPMGKWDDKDVTNYYRAIDGIELLP